MTKYSVELTQEQLDLVAKALEVYSRMHAGQFHIAFEEAIPKRVWALKKDHNVATHYEGLLHQLKAMLFSELSAGSYYGVSSIKEAPKLGEAQTIAEALREFTKWRPLKGPKMCWGRYPIPEVKPVKRKKNDD